MKNLDDKKIIAIAKDVFKSEIQALNLSVKNLDANFLKAVHLIAKTKGRVAIIGIGKSGIIGRKIAATMSSTGTQAFFVHPSEALHGDLGMIGSDDIIFALSFSGQTEEIGKILPALKKRKLTIISMTGNANSNLAKASDVHVKVTVTKEACPYNLAPTSSTTAMLAMGDAMALCLMEMKGFGQKDFAVFHPGGSLGKLLTNSVKDIMKSGKWNPVIINTASVKDSLLIMTKTKAGAVSIIDKSGKLLGFFTDGDLRRALQKDETVLNKKITDVMTKNPTALKDTMPAVEAAKIIHEKKIDNAPVVDAKGKVVGILDENELVEFIALIDKK
ncbi:arabinose-5-phosphate isomerase [Parelusimicrobium proximum]